MEKFRGNLALQRVVRIGPVPEGTVGLCPEGTIGLSPGFNPGNMATQCPP